MAEQTAAQLQRNQNSMQNQRVCLHPDPLRLEQELGDALRACRADKPIPRVLILAPTRRQVARVRRILAVRFQGLLGVDVSTHLGFVFRLLESDPESGGAASLETMEHPLREALVERLLNQASDSPLKQYAESYSRVASSLGSLFGELREAGIDPASLAEAAAPGWEQSVSDLYASYTAALGRLEGSGNLYRDRAALTRAASAAAAKASPYDLVVQYGATELVGMNLQLVNSIPATQKLWLVPADAEAPSWERARAFAERHLPRPVEALDDLEPQPLLHAARSLGRWKVNPEPLPQDAVVLIHAQGPEAELAAAARWALRELNQGAEPSSLAIISRTLSPYESTAEAVFRRHRLPIDTTMGQPLSRHPRAHGLLTWLRVLEGGFERSAMVDLLRAPALRRKKGVLGWWPDLWDRWSRTYNVARGADQWKGIGAFLEAADAPDAVRTSAAVLSDFVDSLAEDLHQWQGCKTAGDHAAFIAANGSKRIRPVNTKQQQEVALAIESVLTALRSLDVAHAATGSSPEFSTREVLSFMERTMQSTSVPWSQPGGVAFLDVMQARGLSFDKVYFVGFNTGITAGRVENLFLSDATRNQLSKQLQVPLGTRRDAEIEEKQLMAQVAAAAREHLVLSWQRADAEGKSRAPALALQDWSRLLPGPQDLARRLAAEPPEGPRRVPTNPANLAAFYQEWLGFAAPVDSALALAAEARFLSREAVLDFWSDLRPEMREHRPVFEPFIQEIQSRKAAGAHYDGFPGRDYAWAGVFSPSSLELAGGCAAKFFFRQVLRLRALEDSAEETSVDDLTLGRNVHSVLEGIYEELTDTNGGFQDASANLPEVIRSHWNRHMSAAERRMGAFPRLWNSLEALWLQEIEAFVRKDLKRLPDWALEGVEKDVSTSLELALGDGAVRIALQGRLDRITRRGELLMVSDYKTGGHLEKWIEPKAYLRGSKLQLPLYQLMVEREVSGKVAAELLGLGPKFFPDKGFVRADPVTLNKKFNHDGFLETVAVVADTVTAGKFPLSAGRHCSYCEYARACRKDHYTSRERVQADPANQNYFLMKAKDSKKPMLENVRRGRDAS